MNIRSIVNKIDVFQNYVYSRSLDIVGITETWLSDKIFDNEILPSMYTIIHKDRGSCGGGVMFVIKSSKSIQVLSTPPSVEVLTVCVEVTTPTVYCLTYIPPNPPENYWQEFLDYIESLNNISSNIVLLGDFNCSDINWSSLCGQYPFTFVMSYLILSLIFPVDRRTYSFFWQYS